ncbi:hypothetical protein GGF44_005496, partial [Coemansia sp. RSA 1694]
LLLKIQAAKTTIMRGDQGASLYQLEDASLAIAALCNRMSNPIDVSTYSGFIATRTMLASAQWSSLLRWPKTMRAASGDERDVEQRMMPGGRGLALVT